MQVSFVLVAVYMSLPLGSGSDGAVKVLGNFSTQAKCIKALAEDTTTRVIMQDTETEKYRVLEDGEFAVGKQCVKIVAPKKKRVTI